MNYKYLLLALLSLGIAAEEKKPNIIIFLVDDLGWADISLRGANIDTPAIDSLFTEGMALDRFYTTPICFIYSPSYRCAANILFFLATYNININYKK